MTQPDQAQHFANDLEALITRYRHEYDLTYSTMVGVLHLQTFMLCREAEKACEEDAANDNGE